MSDNLPEAVDPAPAMFALIERMASNPQVDIGKLQALLDMQERLENRQREAAFNAAFARLQQRLPRITKKGEIKYDANPDAKTAAGRKGSATAYARWEDIMEAILPHLHDEGFALTYDAPPGPDGRITCIATLIHRDGHSRSSSFGPMPLDTSGGKNNLQAAGSTDSYGKRFATRDLLNLVYEGLDDDGVRGGMTFITAVDVAEIEALITETKSDRLRFLEYMGVAELENVQARDKDRALVALRRKQSPPAGGPDAAARGARGGSGKAPAAAAAEDGDKTESVPGQPRNKADAEQPRQPVEEGASALSRPATDLVADLDRRLAEAAHAGKRALDSVWIKLSPHEQDLARGRRQHYYDLAQQRAAK